MNECGDDLDGAFDVVGALIVLHDTHSHALFVPSYFLPWGSLSESLIPMFMSILINHRDWSEWAETSNERALHVQIAPVSRESNRVRRTRQEFDQR
jgi:hypothetical protein